MGLHHQGQEERIIFISTVLTQRATVQCSDDHVDPNLAFLTSPQRFNVATSRAKVRSCTLRDCTNPSSREHATPAGVTLLGSISERVEVGACRC
jgi:superfamily I DNA and/or RNA helicase